ncbi:ferric reductase-like transmembrane domain-containing protein [Candidatus Saccharibacteria bacterium]|nr:ferric reductase-like transmembrane domain-containing protein [Candidatus Saccharibacteria bacterium]
MSENTKRTLLIGTLVITILPLPFIVKHPSNWGNLQQIWLYTSAVLGYVGLVGLLWMYIIGTKSVIGLYFTDLAKINQLHRWLGTYGTVLVFLHPVAATLAYSESLVTYSLLPRFGSPFEQSVTWGRFAFWVLLVVWVTSALVRSNIHYRPWKYIHYFAYVALPLALLHIPSIGSSYRTLSVPRVYFVSILVLAGLFTVLRLRHLFALGRAEYTITQHIPLAPQVMLVKLKPLRSMLSPRRGQYVYLQKTLLGAGHPFSVVQVDVSSGDITLAYKQFGPFTTSLAELKTGEKVFLDGPYGLFTSQRWRRTSRPAVFIAGGIGITPFVDHVLHDDGRSWLFYASQNRTMAAFWPHLSKALGTRFVQILSDESTALRQGEVDGYISKEILGSRLHDPSEFEFFICGPEGFMRATADILASLGVPANQVHTESFSF